MKFPSAFRIPPFALFLLTLTLAPFTALAATPSRLTPPGHLIVQANHPTHAISPLLYGLMTEEINYSYDGGLYAELIRNRIFADNPPPPVRNRKAMATQPAVTEFPPSPAPDQPLYWSLLAAGTAQASFILDRTAAIPDTALTASLRFDITNASATQHVGLANGGYWGIPVRPNTAYQASFYAKAAPNFTGPLTVSIEATNGKTTFASATLPALTNEWRQYHFTLDTGSIIPSAATSTNRFVISAQSPGTIWLNLVSLFPPTYNNRPNGNRIDLMQKLDDLHPAFLRFPGGNYLQGEIIADRFPWQSTLHTLDQRPGHMGTWQYRSSDGLGLLEYLEWCEDLRMQPVLAVFGGFALRGQRAVGPDLQPYIQEALNEIEYVTGSAATKWGSERLRDGHPDAFPLTYVEIGNEDNFDNRDDGAPAHGSGTYDQRFAQFFDAIKAKYPSLQIIATTNSVKSRKPDLIDDHFYRTAVQMQADTHHYDAVDRTGPKIMVGEWATREGGATSDLNAALGDAAWMTGLERNSDLVVMACYAPLLVNMNKYPSRWDTDLIGYDAVTSFGSVSYYAQKMFYQNRGDVVLPVDLIPQVRHVSPLPAPAANSTPAADGAPADLPPMFAAASRDNATGDIILKVVNAQDVSQFMDINVQGTPNISYHISGEILTGQPTDINSLAQPEKCTPRKIAVSLTSPHFSYPFPSYSITVLRFIPTP